MSSSTSRPSPLKQPLTDTEWHSNCLPVCSAHFRSGDRGVLFCPVQTCTRGHKSPKLLHLHIHRDHFLCLLCHGTGHLQPKPSNLWINEAAFKDHLRLEHRTCVFSDCGLQFPEIELLLRHYEVDHPMRCCVNCHNVPLPKPVSTTPPVRDVLCKRCLPGFFVRAPTLLELPSGHDAFLSVFTWFYTNWKHPSKKSPIVKKIWKIYGKSMYVQRYNAYKRKIEARTGLKNGESQRRWHGTTRACRLGDTSASDKICDNPNCSLCRIIETNFNLIKAGQKTNWGRFGSGIYTSKTSSKAHDYVDELGGSEYKTMLLNAVVMGRTKHLYENQPHLTQPPPGCDSVTGLPGHDLNYDESVVYDHDAIRPMYLIVYH